MPTPSLGPSRRRSSANSSPGMAALPGSFRGATRRRPRGRCWSARRCCSRPPWPGYCLLTSSGSPAGRLRPRSRQLRQATPSARGTGLATRGGRCACTAAATTIVARHAGQVPADYAQLLALPGVGDYTAAAVAAFAFRQRQVVLDTNVRRVLARAVSGSASALEPHRQSLNVGSQTNSCRTTASGRRGSASR